MEAAANAAGLHLQIYKANSPAEIDITFEAIARDQIPALIVAADPFFDTRADQLVALAAQRAVPVMYQFRQYPGAGGLISYGPDLPDAYRQAGIYVTKPTELPQESKFEFVIIADEVIE